MTRKVIKKTTTYKSKNLKTIFAIGAVAGATTLYFKNEKIRNKVNAKAKAVKDGFDDYNRKLKEETERLQEELKARKSQ